jgi:hypothetical protein
LFTYKHMIKCSKHISNMSFQQLLFKGQWFWCKSLIVFICTSSQNFVLVISYKTFKMMPLVAQPWQDKQVC